MQISYGKPIEKGVTRLMYVGDDLQPGSRLTWPFVILLSAAVYWALAYPSKR